MRRPTLHGDFLETSGDLTQLLDLARDGDQDAHSQLYTRLYDDLKQCARRQLARLPSATLTPTALVNETYLRLSDLRNLSIDNRRHYLAMCVSAMRHILIDYYRAGEAQKRGGEAKRAAIDIEELGAQTSGVTLLEIDDSLERLRDLRPRLAQVVEFKFYLGLKETEIAEVLGLTDRTVRMDWRKARAWLSRELAS
ncbi:MAG: sigma-70 family RNA polymerase sigma factor [Gammaproteobacteria bacterium]|nr:sigma-70 family RNA polymerase sigma factor [Gammaproteobacteria bacterium]